MSSCASCEAELDPKWKFCIHCGTPLVPGAIRPDADEPARFNMLAILALLLACIGGAPALVFGHIAIGQIKESGERGMLMARIATALGYFWLVVWVVIITLLVTGVWR
jgi:hypothetical protein